MAYINNNHAAIKANINVNTKDIDFSSFVLKTLKIAGIDLADNITALEMQEALRTYPLLMYNGAPTPTTKGKTGQLYLDEIHKRLYVCIGRVVNQYTWYDITVDLDKYVLKTRKIAGFSLTEDITVEELLTALNISPFVVRYSAVEPQSETVGQFEYVGSGLAGKRKGLYVLLDKTGTRFHFATKEDVEAGSQAVPSTIRIPPFEEIDNTPFKNMIKACADNWLNASAESGIVYDSLSVSDVDKMAISVNPMIYATRNDNKEFTETYRDIWGEVKAGGTKAVNCITLANMLVMGIPFEQSRLNSHENNVGAMGYAFDICKYIDSTKEGDTVLYSPGKKLDITTFERILTQASFTETYNTLGLVKTVKTSASATDGDIWYDAIKPGDVLFNSSHTMFCTDVETTTNGFIIHYIDAGSNNTPSVEYHKITVTGTEVSLSESKLLVKVARPYYTHTGPSLLDLMNHNRKKFKGVDGPYPGIGNGEDLNAYLIVGEFRCASDTNAKSLINKPANLVKAFKLVVENLLDDSTALTGVKYRYLKQTITDVYGTEFYRIVKCDNTFSSIISTTEWHEVTANDLSSGAVTIGFNSTYVTATPGGLNNSYVVKNGVCYGTLDFTTTTNLDNIVIANGLPTPPISFCFGCFHTDGSAGSKCGTLVIEGGNIVAKGFQGGCQYMLSFSYPIA